MSSIYKLPSGLSKYEIMKRYNAYNQLQTENKRLKKAIESFGKNPAGFDWAVLEKIEQLKAENNNLKERIDGYKRHAKYLKQVITSFC